VTVSGLAALAEAAALYGIKAFDDVLKPLWLGIHLHRRKDLTAFLKVIGSSSFIGLDLRMHSQIKRNVV
jgi:splicing factor 3B subunit 1